MNHSYVDADIDADLQPTVERETRTMRQHVPDLDAFLRIRNIGYVSAEYSGAEDKGGFISLQFVLTSGGLSYVTDAPRILQLKAVFRALLLERHPTWCRNHGSCGDFRWDLQADSLTHTHYLRDNGNERLTLHGLG